jgi:hypothetical protein
MQSPINRAFLNENNRQAFYRTPSINPIPSNNTSWTMRNSYQNIARKSVNKTRHNSISKKKIYLLLFIYLIPKKKESNCMYKKI